jgi:glucose/arabinose dehydrogenase
VATGLFSPTAMAIANDGSNRIFVTEQTGDVRVVKNGQLLTNPFVRLNVTSFGEHGLLGITFDPDFATNHFVYVYYTVSGTPFHNRLSRFTANGDVAATGSEHVLMETQSLDSSQLYHDGGCIRFGPDGKLYVSTGENEHAENSQDLTNLQGKILRINPDGSIPTDNPFYNTATGINRSIWAYGFRNPFKFAFQPGTGLMYINDVGQDLLRRSTRAPRVGTLAGRTRKAAAARAGVRRSAFYYDHSNACAITGGVFYPTDGSFPAQYRGQYMFNDLCGGWIKMMDPTTHEVNDFATNLPGPVEMAVGPDGALYYLARQHNDDTQDNTGFISVIRETAGQAPSITSQPTDRTAAIGSKVTFTVSAGGQAPLSYQWQRNGHDIAGATSSSYTINAAALVDSGATYRVKISNPIGQVFSSAATLTVINDKAPAASIRFPAAGTTFYAGETLSYYGKATDAEDGELGASRFTWQVDYHTGDVTRPFVQPRSGVTKGSFVIPTVTPVHQEQRFLPRDPHRHRLGRDCHDRDARHPAADVERHRQDECPRPEGPARRPGQFRREHVQRRGGHRAGRSVLTRRRRSTARRTSSPAGPTVATSFTRFPPRPRTRPTPPTTRLLPPRACGRRTSTTRASAGRR